MSTLQTINVKHPSSGSNNVVLDSSGNTTVSGALTVSGNATITGTLQANGVSGTIYPLTLMTAQASTSGTAIDFTGIPSWVRRVTVIFNGVSTNGTSLKIVQIGSGSFTSSGYSGGGGAIGTASAGGTSATTGFLVGIFNLASDTIAGVMTIANTSGNSWVASFAGGSASGNFGSASGGAVSLSGVLDRIRITTVGGTDTFDAGTINILYE